MLAFIKLREGWVPVLVPCIPRSPFFSLEISNRGLLLTKKFFFLFGFLSLFMLFLAVLRDLFPPWSFGIPGFQERGSARRRPSVVVTLFLFLDPSRQVATPFAGGDEELAGACSFFFPGA